MSEGDVDGLLDQVGEPATELSDELASFLRELLDPHGERTLPARLVLAGRRRRAAADIRARRAGPDGSGERLRIASALTRMDHRVGQAAQGWGCPQRWPFSLRTRARSRRWASRTRASRALALRQRR